MCTAGRDYLETREARDSWDPIFPRPFSHDTNNSGLQADTVRGGTVHGGTLPRAMSHSCKEEYDNELRELCTNFLKVYPFCLNSSNLKWSWTILVTHGQLASLLTMVVLME